LVGVEFTDLGGGGDAVAGKGQHGDTRGAEEIDEVLGDVVGVGRGDRDPGLAQLAQGVHEREGRTGRGDPRGGAYAFDLGPGALRAEHEAAAGARPHGGVDTQVGEFARTHPQHVLATDVEQGVHPVGVLPHEGVYYVE